MGKRDERRKKSLVKKKEVRINREVKQSFRYVLTIAYDGSTYGGYAKQKHKNTIQNELESVLTKYFKYDIKTTESSRTDSKVHALDQQVMFDVENQINLKKFKNEVKELLNSNIIILDIKEVPKEFHCRYDVESKTYEYTIMKLEDPRYSNYRWFVGRELNVDNMIIASEDLIGKHDFVTFRASKATTDTTVRTINFIDIKEDNDNITIQINADGFLYNMVRLIVKALVDIGSERRETSYISELLEMDAKPDHFESAPARGLCLMKINYKQKD